MQNKKVDAYEAPKVVTYGEHKADLDPKHNHGGGCCRCGFHVSRKKPTVK